MKLYIDGTEYCDVVVLDETRQEYHEIGRISSIGSDTRIRLGLTDFLETGAGETRVFHIGDEHKRIKVSPYGRTNKDFEIDAFLEHGP